MWHPSVFALVYFIYGITASIIRFEATPASVKQGLTSTLTLHCALNDSAASAGIVGRRDVTQTSSNVAEVTSLIVSKNGVDIAAVTQHSPAHIMDNSTNIQVTGSVSGLTGGQGFIDLVISNPSPDQVGEYVCESNALTDVGHNVVFSTSLELSSSQPTMADLVTYIHDLRQQLDTVVIFSASLSKDAHVLKGQRVVYDIINSNVGSGYNSTTGEFICPVDGYYHFEMSALGLPNQRYWLNLQHNGQDVISIHGAGTDFQGMTNSASIHLTKGDVVSVVPWYESYLHSRAMDQIYTTFNGRLLAVDTQ